MSALNTWICLSYYLGRTLFVKSTCFANKVRPKYDQGMPEVEERR
ncbi:hypothetical protein HDC92_004705 [Pedobacter sp. AK017]|nr:hypothetical protein [Pedobacter sp. AK017]